MRRRDRILAEVLDSLIAQDTDAIPPEVGELLNLGLRLHNECPAIDPSFQERLGRRLAIEWAASRQASQAPRGRRGLLVILGLLRPLRGLPALAAVATAAAVILLAAALPGLRSSVQAGLGRAIAVFHAVEVDQQPRMVASPPPTPLAQIRYSSLEETQAALDFRLRVPSDLPVGVRFRQAVVQEAEGWLRVILHYHNPEQDSGYDRRSLDRGFEGEDDLILQQFRSTQTPEEVGVSVEVGLDASESIVVAGRRSLWVQGQWGPGGRWARGSPGGMLLIPDGDVFVLLRSSYGREESIRIAESLLQ